MIRRSKKAKGKPRLGVKPVGHNNDRFHHPFTRLLGLSLLYSLWNNDGELLPVPHVVTVAQAEQYEVHHLKDRWGNCELRGLVVVSVALHQKLTSGTIKDLPMPPGGQPVRPPQRA